MEVGDPFGPRPPGGWRCPTCGRSCQMAGARFPNGLSIRNVVCGRCGGSTRRASLHAKHSFAPKCRACGLDFDAFVKLRNLDGVIVSFNDECGTMRNARVVFEPTVTGTYRVVASSYADRATGAFRLSVCEE